MRDTAGQKWRICSRCFRPYDRADHTSGCPRCTEAVRSMRRSDSTSSRKATVPRVSPVGDGAGRTGENEK